MWRDRTDAQVIGRGAGAERPTAVCGCPGCATVNPHGPAWRLRSRQAPKPTAKCQGQSRETTHGSKPPTARMAGSRLPQHPGCSSAQGVFLDATRDLEVWLPNWQFIHYTTANTPLSMRIGRPRTSDHFGTGQCAVEVVRMILQISRRPQGPGVVALE